LFMHNTAPKNFGISVYYCPSSQILGKYNCFNKTTRDVYKALGVKLDGKMIVHKRIGNLWHV
jgi:hypothetical protein